MRILIAGTHASRRALCFAAALASLGRADGQDSAAWRQHGYDPQHTGHNPSEALVDPGNVANLEVAWTRGTPCSIRSYVAVVEGIAYYGHYCSEFLAVDAATGATIWNNDLNGKHQGHAIVDGVAYVSALNRVYAFDAATGGSLWSWDGGNSKFGAPIVSDGTILITSSAANLLHALDTATGTELWSLPGARGTAIDGPVFYATIGNQLEARDLTSGGLLWSGSTSIVSRMSWPVVANGVVYVHADTGLLYAFDADGCGQPTCTPLWTATTQPNVAENPQAPAVAHGMVYAGAGATMYAFDATGCASPPCSPVWTADTSCSFFNSPPAVANGVLYSTCGNSYLYAFDTATGEILWQYYTAGSGYPMRSTPTIVDGRLYHCATFDFTLYTFEVPYDYDGLGSPYCFPAVPNSTGLSARIAAFGSDEVVDNNFILNATDMPANQSGYFLASETQGFVQQPPGSQGNLCLGGNIGRFVHQLQNSGGSGNFTIQVDLTDIPTTPPSKVLVGENWNFQAWFRDTPAQSSNFTDGVSVTFR